VPSSHHGSRGRSRPIIGPPGALRGRSTAFGRHSAVLSSSSARGQRLTSLTMVPGRSAGASGTPG
jgi:hypothetical protein